MPSRDDPGRRTIRVSAPDEHAARLLPRYLKNRRHDLAKLLGFVRKGDLESVRKMAHNWKGTGTSFGVPKITELGAAIEAAAKNGDGALCRRLAIELYVWLRRVEIV